MIDEFIDEVRVQSTDCSFCHDDLHEATERYNCSTCIRVACAGSACYGCKFQKVGRL